MDAARVEAFKRLNRPYGWPFFGRAPGARPAGSSRSFAGLGSPEPVPRVFRVDGGMDQEAIEKVHLLRDQVIRPALEPGRYGLPYTRTILSEILWGAPRRVDGHSKALIAQRIWSWLKNRVRYVNDPDGEEVFTAFPEILNRGIGDCDDFLVATAVLFKAAGIPVRARIIQTPSSRGWSHIYPVANLKGRWVPFEGTVPNVPPGWEYPAATRRLDIEV